MGSSGGTPRVLIARPPWTAPPHLGHSHSGRSHLRRSHLGRSHLGRSHLGRSHLGLCSQALWPLLPHVSRLKPLQPIRPFVLARVPLAAAAQACAARREAALVRQLRTHTHTHTHARTHTHTHARQPTLTHTPAPVRCGGKRRPGLARPAAVSTPRVPLEHPSSTRSVPEYPRVPRARGGHLSVRAAAIRRWPHPLQRVCCNAAHGCNAVCCSDGWPLQREEQPPLGTARHDLVGPNTRHGPNGGL